MTKDKAAMDVEEGNKLIAEFMGAKVRSAPDAFWPDDISKNRWYAAYEPGNNPVKWISSGMDRQLSELRYHYSYDWLMPVVEKIERFIEIEYRREIIITKNRCQMICLDYESILKVGETKLDATWKAVIEFIQCYNNQNNPQ